MGYRVCVVLCWLLNSNGPCRTSQEFSGSGCGTATSWYSISILFRRVAPGSLCVFGMHFWNPCTVLALFISLGTKVHASTTLFEKKFLLVSSLEAYCFRFSGSEALLVVLTVASTLWNHVLLATLSCPCIILNIWTISAWWRRSSRVVRPSSFNLSSYVVAYRFSTDF